MFSVYRKTFRIVDMFLCIIHWPMLDIADVSIAHNCDLAIHFLRYPKYNESTINHPIYQNDKKVAAFIVDKNYYLNMTVYLHNLSKQSIEDREYCNIVMNAIYNSRNCLQVFHGWISMAQVWEQSNF